MKSQPQNPEFKNNPETFHPCKGAISPKLWAHEGSDKKT